MALSAVDHGYYNSHGFQLHIGLAQAAIEQIVLEARAASTSRDLQIVLAKPSLYNNRGLNIGIRRSIYCPIRLSNNR
jgi:hypothetical protein